MSLRPALPGDGAWVRPDRPPARRQAARRAPGRWAVGFLSLTIRLYRVLLSPVFGPSCRFLPTCSVYAIEALQVHGPARGGWLALRRVARCHPWGGAGYDPVPPSGAAASPHVRSSR